MMGCVKLSLTATVEVIEVGVGTLPRSIRHPLVVEQDDGVAFNLVRLRIHFPPGS